MAGKSATVFVYRLPASSDRFDGPAGTPSALGEERGASGFPKLRTPPLPATHVRDAGRPPGIDGQEVVTKKGMHYRVATLEIEC
jgi:hypothetical protein